jgi:hypothetical protein
MPTSNLFDRTICFVREKPDGNGGRFRFKRIPWDLIAFGNAGFLVSPSPVVLNPFSEVSTDTSKMEVLDLDSDEDVNDLNDEVVSIMYFESEQDFYSRFDGVFGYYKSDSGQSAEFGYPNSRDVH